MEGWVVLITGSTDGIGKQTALDLARMGAWVLLHGRNWQKGEAAKKDIREKSGNDKIDLFIADLSSISQVRKLASEIQERYNRLPSWPTTPASI